MDQTASRVAARHTEKSGASSLDAFRKLVEEAEQLASELGATYRRGRDDGQLPMGFVDRAKRRCKELSQKLDKIKG